MQDLTLKSMCPLSPAHWAPLALHVKSAYSPMFYLGLLLFNLQGMTFLRRWREEASDWT
jgi:hypothetical protein